MLCKLKKFLYSLKQTSHQWFFKFDQVLTSFDFKENVVNESIYPKVSGSKIIILVCVNDIVIIVMILYYSMKLRTFYKALWDERPWWDNLCAIQIDLVVCQICLKGHILFMFLNTIHSCSPGECPIVRGETNSLSLSIIRIKKKSQTNCLCFCSL